MLHRATHPVSDPPSPARSRRTMEELTTLVLAALVRLANRELIVQDYTLSTIGIYASVDRVRLPRCIDALQAAGAITVIQRWNRKQTAIIQVCFETAAQYIPNIDDYVDVRVNGVKQCNRCGLLIFTSAEHALQHGCTEFRPTLNQQYGNSPYCTACVIEVAGRQGLQL